MINLKTSEWEIKNIDTVLFDKDGTLIDLHFFWGKMIEMRVQKLIEKYCLKNNCHKDLCDFLGFDILTQKMYPDGITALYSRAKIIELFIDELKKYEIKTCSDDLEKLFDDVSEEFYENLEQYVKPINEAVEFAKKIKEKGIKLGIVTADSIISTNRSLEFLNIKELFDVIVARESCTERKETGKPTLYALEKLNSEPQNTVMIGDTPIDFESAKKAGIEKTILVATGQLTKDELKNISPFSLHSLSEIKCFLF